MNRAMAQLRPRDRAMLWMAYAEGSSHDEIASVIGVRPSSMKLLLFRARQRMAKLLERRAVRQIECRFEADVLAAAIQSRWPWIGWTPSCGSM